MIHSDTLNELATALAAAQGEFESVDKTSTNPFFKSKYAALPDVVKAATPILCSHGLSVTQTLGHDDVGDTLTTMVLHTSGQFIADTMRLRPIKDDPQAQGSATTYGRRYAYMAALGLVAEEDDDGNAGSAGQRRQAPKPAKAAKPKPAAKPKTDLEGAGPGGSAPESPSTDKADVPAPSPDADAIVDKVRAVFERSGWTAEQLKWGLVEVEAPDIEALNSAATPEAKREAIAACISGLTVEKTVLLVESMGGTAQDLA